LPSNILLNCSVYKKKGDRGMRRKHAGRIALLCGGGGKKGVWNSYTLGPGPITAGDIPEDERLVYGTAFKDWRSAHFESAIRHALAIGVGLKRISQAAADAAIRIAVAEEEGNLQRAAKRLDVTDRALQLRRANRRLDMGLLWALITASATL
jgi:hypothetical protein